MTPACLSLVVIFSILILTLPRRLLAVPFILGMCFIPGDKSLVFATLDFYAVRIFVFVAVLRLIIRGEHNSVELNKIDYLFYTWQFFRFSIYVLKSGDISSFIFSSGQAVDSIGVYYVFRHTFSDLQNLNESIKWFAICCIGLVPFAAYESMSGRSLFEILGQSHTIFRDGRFRSAGTFSHPILLGSFAAALIPIFWGKYKSKFKRNKQYFLISICSALFLIYACASSGPILSVLAAIFFLCLFKFRSYSKQMVYGFILTIISLHIVMNAPVWQLIARVSVVGSSAAYHRYLLINAAILEMKEWFWLGYGNTDPGWYLKYWSYTNNNFTDITNQYIIEAVYGGMITLIFFVWLCLTVLQLFKRLSLIDPEHTRHWLWWGMCAGLMSHYVTFLSVSYFGQIKILLFWSFALAASLMEQLYIQKKWALLDLES